MPHAFTIQQYTTISNSSHYFFIVDISNLCVMCGSADLYDKWVRSRLAN